MKGKAELLYDDSPVAAHNLATVFVSASMHLLRWISELVPAKGVISGHGDGSSGLINRNASHRNTLLAAGREKRSRIRSLKMAR